MPPKAVFCGYDAPGRIGGPTRWLVKMLPRLAQRGIEPCALWMIDPSHDIHDPTSAPNAHALRSAGIQSRVTALDKPTQNMTRWYLKQLQELSPDVFVPDLCIPACYAGRWCREAGIPTIAVLRSDEPFYWDLCEAFVSGDTRYRVSCCVSVSHYLASLARRTADGVRIEAIPSGAIIPAARAKAPSDAFHIMYSGRLVQKQKRVLDVAEALHKITSQLPRTRAVIHGNGAQAGEVRARLQELNALGRVRLGGALEPDALQATLLDQHALLLLSDYEGTPIAVMEAMACGVVPICLAIRSGIPDIVRDGENGLIVYDRDKDVVRAVRRLIEEPGLWQRLSSAARVTAEETFNIEICADRWAVLIGELHASAPPRKKLRFPRVMRLPSPKPGFAHEDPRPLGLLKRCRRALRDLRALLRKIGRR